MGQPIAAVQLVDGRILLFGPPLDRSSTIDSDAMAYELDLAQPRATKIADLPGCRGVDDAVVLADGRVVLRCAYGGETRPGCWIQAPASRRSSTFHHASAARWSCWPRAGTVHQRQGDHHPHGL